MAPIHYEECVASLMSLSVTQHLAAQNLPERNTFKGRIMQHIMHPLEWYEHKEETVGENEQPMVLWNMSIIFILTGK